jgi:polysaccharide biosynthesis protein PslG
MATAVSCDANGSMQAGIGVDYHPVIFGVSDPQLLNEAPAVQRKQLERMREAGITAVRFDADWASVQPKGPHTFYWTSLDQAVESSRAAGMSVDLIIDGCPRWAAVAAAKDNNFAQPASPVSYGNWARDVATRYAPMGVHVFEIWNEPNIRRFWAPRPNPAAYVEDLKAAYIAIKNVEPSATIVTGGLAPIGPRKLDYPPVAFLRAMYEHGAKGYFSAVGYHPYSFPALPNTPDPASGWSQINVANPSLRSIMRAYGDGNKPLWLTEFGAPSGGPDGVGLPLQAKQLSQAIGDVSRTSFISALFVYTWQDGGTSSTFGLLTAGGAPKPAYAAVASAIKAATAHYAAREGRH